MCVVSMVMDDFNKRFYPWIQTIPSQPIGVQPFPAVNPFVAITPIELSEIRQLIREFREAVAAAKTVDRLTKQPDCEDPEKAKLLERVATLEARLSKLESQQKEAH